MNFKNIFRKSKRFFSNVDFLKNISIFRGEDGDDDDGSPPPPPPPCPPSPPSPPKPPCPPCPPDGGGGGGSNEVFKLDKKQLASLASEGIEFELPVINLDDLPEDEDFYITSFPGQADDPTAAAGIKFCPAPPACVRVGAAVTFPAGENDEGQDQVCKVSANVDVPVQKPGNACVSVNVATTF